MKPDDAETAIDRDSMTSWKAGAVDSVAWLAILLFMWAVAR